MEASVVLIASVTVNVCVLFVLVVSWMLRRRRGGSGGHEVEGLADGGHEESDMHEQKPAKHNVQQTSTESMDAYVSVYMIYSTNLCRAVLLIACFVNSG